MKKKYIDLKKEARTPVLSEGDFEEKMAKVTATLEEVGERGFFENSIYEKLYYEWYPRKHPKGTIVISHGFIESAPKFRELAYYFRREGYQVAIFEHRGHGKSHRETKDKRVVHVERFSHYVEDLHEFVTGFVQEKTQGMPLYLFGHSMGGGIGALYLEDHPEVFDKAILSCPMLGINTKGVPLWTTKLLCYFMEMIGQGERGVFIHPDFLPYMPYAIAPCDSRARHKFYLDFQGGDRDYQHSKASYHWAKESILACARALEERRMARVKIPVLEFQAGHDGFVNPKEEEQFAEKIKDGRLVIIRDSRHEIYRAKNPVLRRYLDMIFDFLQEQ